MKDGSRELPVGWCGHRLQLGGVGRAVPGWPCGLFTEVERAGESHQGQADVCPGRRAGAGHTVLTGAWWIGWRAATMPYPCVQRLWHVTFLSLEYGWVGVLRNLPGARTRSPLPGSGVLGLRPDAGLGWSCPWTMWGQWFGCSFLSHLTTQWVRPSVHGCVCPSVSLSSHLPPLRPTPAWALVVRTAVRIPCLCPSPCGF